MKRRELVGVLAGAMISARTLRAQPTTVPVVGFLGNASPRSAASFVAAFREGLSDAGFTEGQNVTIEYRWAEGHYDRLPAFAADFVNRKVDVILATAGVGIAAAKGSTSTIPIVFFGGDDLVAAGLVASLARPGGNLTGVSIYAPELNPKRFQLLSELVPHVQEIALLVNPTGSRLDLVIRDMEEAARASGRRLSIVKASTEDEIDTALADLVQLHAGGLVVMADPFFNSRRKQIVVLAARHAVPAIYEWREFADAGGLISYGPILTDGVRQVGVYVGRVLAGADPADMPIQRPSRLELVVNLKTAKALGLTIPPTVLARADEVIE
jgi:putative tryptophan/tyrosine transport system substrate-binding protein